MAVDGLPPGDWAEWVSGVGTVLAFGATSAAFWQGHRLHRVEHAETMLDEALKVTSDVAQGSQDVEVVGKDGMSEVLSQSKVNVHINTGSRRQITNIRVHVTSYDGAVVDNESTLVGDSTTEFIQANDGFFFVFDPIDGIWTRSGPACLVTFTFEDIDETKWERHWSGRLQRFRRLRRKRRDGRRHATRPSSRP